MSAIKNGQKPPLRGKFTSQASESLIRVKAPHIEINVDTISQNETPNVRDLYFSKTVIATLPK